MLVAADASAARSKPRTLPRIPDTDFFSDAGNFAGVLEGEIQLNGVRYVLPSNVKIYVVGQGAVPAGTAISQRMISITGVQRGYSNIVRQVIVRPSFASFGESSSLSEADPARPR
jgi:hypothetical protein